jgi:hypothetical protein
MKYDGSLIHKRFAYDLKKDNVNPLGDIHFFTGEMEVEGPGMIDKEDLINNDFIYSEKAINIVWEIPNLCPMGAVFFQRYFNTQIANIIFSINQNHIISIKGDDILIHDEEFIHGCESLPDGVGKCSVSITYTKDNIALGHTGINMIAGDRAPKFAYSLNFTTEEISTFMARVHNVFYSVLKNCFVATSKITL